jgi:hypothetical protein
VAKEKRKVFWEEGNHRGPAAKKLVFSSRVKDPNKEFIGFGRR